ncbi:MAG TPA: LytTR family DNA-binding domain-containing protein [Cyclobacteriaceae bacterium]|nr:LytTR family DNA-binding domain-containing protein [Cyclobacteriaceae bacterium]
MKILLIEDEPLVAKDLKSLIMKLEPAAQVLEVLTSVTGARRWLSENELPDLILSDIQLSDGVSFEIFENSEINCPIIFTTAYDAFAIRAFKLNSIDYLLKPIDENELQKALAKFKVLSRANGNDSLQELIRHLNKQPQKYKERFLSPQRNSLVPVVVNEIAFFNKEELIFINNLKGEKLLSEHATLDELEALVDPALFFRVNRQFLVHIQVVARIKTTHKGLSIQLKPPFTSIELDLSREKASAFKKWLG